jgi:hypothetical protein
MNEIWKDIPNYEGLYQVSNLGRVKSLPKTWIAGKGRIRTHNGLILSLHVNKKNTERPYYAIYLSKDKKRKFFSLHQLVAMAFLGHIPCGYKLVVDHINNNSLDNSVDNLQIVTHRINASKDIKNKTSKYTGVCWDKTAKKWAVNIRFNSKKFYLGLFKDEYQAHLTYQKALSELEKSPQAK